MPFLELKVPTQGGPLMCKLTNPEPCLLCEPLNTAFSVIQLCLTLVFATSWMVAHQAPLSMGFSKQGYGSGLPCPPPGDLPDTGMEPVSLMSPALVGRIFTTAPPGRLLGGPSPQSQIAGSSGLSLKLGFCRIYPNKPVLNSSPGLALPFLGNPPNSV